MVSLEKSAAEHGTGGAPDAGKGDDKVGVEEGTSVSGSLPSSSSSSTSPIHSPSSGGGSCARPAGRTEAGTGAGAGGWLPPDAWGLEGRELAQEATRLAAELETLEKRARAADARAQAGAEHAKEKA